MWNVVVIHNNRVTSTLPLTIASQTRREDFEIEFNKFEIYVTLYNYE